MRARAEDRLAKLVYGGSLDSIFSGGEVLITISEYRGGLFSPDGKIVTKILVSNGNLHKSFG